MTYDITGEMHSFVGVLGTTCWGVVEDGTGVTSITPLIANEFKIESLKVRITGQQWVGDNTCIVLSADRAITIDTIEANPPPTPITVNGLLAAVVIIGVAAAAVGYVMYKRSPKSNKEVYQSAKGSGGKSTINRIRDTVWR